VGKKISKVKEPTGFIAINSLTSDGYYGVSNEEISSIYYFDYGVFPSTFRKDFKLDLVKLAEDNKDLVSSIHFNDKNVIDLLLKDEKNKYHIHFGLNGSPSDRKMKAIVCYPTGKKMSDINTYLDKLVKKYLIEDDKNESTVYFITHNGGGYDLQDYNFAKPIINLDLNYGEDFPDTHDKIVSILKQKKTGLLILYSVPGTGKSKYIQSLTDYVDDKKFVYLNSELFTAFDSPQFTSFALSSLKDSVLILEDCENIVTSREIHRGNNVISTLLNLTSGIFADVLNCKIICTFNTTVDNIDEALLRKGRLLIEHQFRTLTPREANKLYEVIHKTENPVPFTKDVTLAEVYNIEEIKTSFKKEKRKIGF
jgi:hypothetical protein